MSNYQKKIYYVTQSQFDTLYGDGTTHGTIGTGTTYTWDPNSIYLVKEPEPVYGINRYGTTQIALSKNGTNVESSAFTVPYATYASALGDGTTPTAAGDSSTPVYFRTDGKPAACSNVLTGTGSSGYLAKWNGQNALTIGPVIGNSAGTYLKNDGSWGTPTNTTYTFVSGTDSFSVTPSTNQVATQKVDITPTWDAITGKPAYACKHSTFYGSSFGYIGISFYGDSYWPYVSFGRVHVDSGTAGRNVTLSLGITFAYLGSVVVTEAMGAGSSSTQFYNAIKVEQMPSTGRSYVNIQMGTTEAMYINFIAVGYK